MNTEALSNSTHFCHRCGSPFWEVRQFLAVNGDVLIHMLVCRICNAKFGDEVHKILAPAA